MSATGYPPKGPRNVTKGFNRPPRSGSQSWGPSNVCNSQNQANAYRPITAQSVFNNSPTKHDFPGSYSTNGYPTLCGSFDTPPSSDVSAQGSPRGSPPAFNHGLPHSFEMPEALSTLSSPGEELHGSNYFELGQKPENNMEQGHGQPVSHYPSATQHHGYETRNQFSPQNRSRQGSTSYTGTQQLDQRSQAKCDEPTSPNSTLRRGQKPPRSINIRRGGNNQAKPDPSFYTIPSASESADNLDETDTNVDELPMRKRAKQTSLTARDQSKICKEVDEVLRNCLFWWLHIYKFNIARNPKARDIETADDRDYDGFCTIINELTAKRQVPRDAVQHERIAELNTVLAGPSEIRHMLAHPERHLKSDWRMLGLIAAAIDVCEILCYHKGFNQLVRCYEATDKLVSMKKIERLMKEMGVDPSKLD
ncbi:hypothetical protein DFH27DRAFT_322848 [Peziza echinospora]|nr:hypothetical protein DFH27DRAFT_322848 [Peziza echinospora]